MATIPQHLDWVAKRAACNVAQVFNEICEGVLSDVKVINEVRKLPPEESFQATFASDGFTLVIGRLGCLPRVVTRINACKDQIIVSHQPASETDWCAEVGLNNEGRCIPRRDGTELEQWQFRKEALESLFFGK